LRQRKLVGKAGRKDPNWPECYVTRIFSVSSPYTNGGQIGNNFAVGERGLITCIYSVH